MRVYIDGCSWTAGWGLPPGHSLKEYLRSIDPSLEILDKSYPGKSNDSLVDDALESHKINQEFDWYVIGMTTPYRFNLYTDDGYRVDFLSTGISGIQNLNGEQFLESDLEWSKSAGELSQKYFQLNSEKQHVLRLIKNYLCLKSIFGSKLRIFNIYPYTDPMVEYFFDNQHWINNWNQKLFDGNYYLDDGHLNTHGMMALAEMIIKKIKE